MCMSAVLPHGAGRLPRGGAVGGAARARLALPRHDLRHPGGAAPVHAGQQRLTPSTLTQHTR
jgi:hypothetical protein